jgi:spore germination protein YaaH
MKKGRGEKKKKGRRLGKSLLAMTLGFALSAQVGCGWSSGETLDRVGQGDGVSIPPRYASVISDGCTPDTWQASALASADMRRVVKEVVLLCAVPRANGDVGPADRSARAQLVNVVGQLHGQGYLVKLGVSFTDETAERFDGALTASELDDAGWRTNVVRGLLDLGKSLDGLEIGMQKLPASASADLTQFMKELRTAVGDSKSIGLLAPPSTKTPSDVPGGDAFDLVSLSAYVDRVRIMTLDFSDPGSGPTIDPGWAVDAVRFAQSRLGATKVDVAMPLYGNDVSDLGTRMVSFFEARAIADEYHLDTLIAPTGAPHLAYTDATGRHHDIFYDDASSTAKVLRAWDPTTLPLDVGVVFYGLGDEDPALWPTLARAMP